MEPTPEQYAEMAESMKRQARELRDYLAAIRLRSRNGPCSCGSGKKYKKCCLDRKPDPLPHERCYGCEHFYEMADEPRDYHCPFYDKFQPDCAAYKEVLPVGAMTLKSALAAGVLCSEVLYFKNPDVIVVPR